MTLDPGTRLGPYEIASRLGEGGMGEVYRARDTRLNRTVAIKVLPADVSADPELRGRFEREARTISNLSHPHICTLYDIGAHDGRDFLVMEYLEGRTLAERLLEGPLPLDELLRHAIDIADALEKAHEQGIVHRDLKPGNVILTRPGAKLLDFGLAKWMPESGESILGTPDQTTQKQPLTTAGTVLGTIPYMAPEQLEGKEADPRTDIFSFGTILYEMATGVRAFHAGSNASLIAAILREHPTAPSEIRPITPRRLDRIIQKCLAKEPADRYRSAHDLKLELQWVARGEKHEEEEKEEAHRVRRWDARRALPLLLAGAGVIALLLAAINWRTSQSTPPARAPIRFSVLPAPGSLFPSIGEGGGFALSPDGQYLVFSATTADGRKNLWLRRLDAEAVEALPGTGGADYPFWSPDSASLAFFAEGKLKRMSIPAGPPQTLCDAAAGRGGTWAANGTILFSPGTGSPLFRIPAAGGTAAQATKLAAPIYSHRWPLFLPDGDHFLYVASSQENARRGLYLASLSGGEVRRVLPSAASVAFAAPDQLFYVRDGLLLRSRFDPERGEIAADSTVISDRLIYFVDRAYAPVSASNTGVIAFRRDAIVNMRLLWRDANGRPLGSVAGIGEYEGVALSPDGRRIAFGAFEPSEGRNHVWIASAEGGAPRRFTFRRGNQYSPVWAPDGSRLVFSDDSDGADALSEKPVRSAGDERRLHTAPQHASQYAQAWSPDGHTILYRTDDPSHGLDIHALDLRTNLVSPFAATSADESQPQFSRDGSRVAYAGTESGRPEIYIQPFPPTGAKWQVSTGGGEQPRWSHDGRTLFYVAADKKLMAVGAGSGTFDGETPRVLFPTDLTVGYLGASQAYDVSPDGRFLIASIDRSLPPSPISVIVR